MFWKGSASIPTVNAFLFSVFEVRLSSGVALKICVKYVLSFQAKSNVFNHSPPPLCLLLFFSCHFLPPTPDSKIYPEMCFYFPKGSLAINYELHVNIYYCPQRYSPQTWPGSLPAGIPERSVLGSGSQRNMQRNQGFGSSTTGDQSISEGEKRSTTLRQWR